MIKWSSNTYSVWGVTLQSVKLKHSSGKLSRSSLEWTHNDLPGRYSQGGETQRRPREQLGSKDVGRRKLEVLLTPGSTSRMIF